MSDLPLSVVLAFCSILWWSVVAVLFARRAPLLPSPRVSAPDLFLGCIVVFVASVFVRGLAASNDSKVAEFAVFGGAFVGLIVLLLLAAQRLSVEGDAFGIVRPRLADVGKGALLYFAVLPPVLAIHAANQYFVGEQQQDAISLWRGLEGVLPRAILVLVLGVIVPVFEECVFRGYLATGLRSGLSERCSREVAELLAVVFSAVLFTLVHPVFTWLPIFLLGAWLGFVYFRTKNLWVVCALHASHNLFTLVYHAVTSQN